MHTMPIQSLWETKYTESPISSAPTNRNWRSIRPILQKRGKRMGNLKMHVTCYVGEKCKQTPLDKTGEEIWEDIVKESKRGDEGEP